MMSERNRYMTTLEKLANKYAEVFGDSPELSFWAWLDATGTDPCEKDLQRVLADNDYWNTEPEIDE